MSKMQRFQLNSVKVIWTMLLLLLFYNFLDSRNREQYFLTAATFVMLIHIWWGTIFYIRHVGPTRNFLEWPLDLSLVGLLILAIFSIDKFVKWFILFGTFFAVVMLKYLIGLNRTRNPLIKKYIKTKLKFETPVAGLFFVCAAVGAVFDYWWIPRMLSIIVFVAQIPFIYILVVRKRVYKIPFD